MGLRGKELLGDGRRRARHNRDDDGPGEQAGLRDSRRVLRAGGRDEPKRPADMEEKAGKAGRAGNIDPSIFIYRIWEKE